MNEGQVVVFDDDGAGEEVGLVAQLRCRLGKPCLRSRGWVGIAVDVEVGVADHVGQQKSFDGFQRAILLPFVGQVAGAVETVGGGPGFHCFFAVGPQAARHCSLRAFCREAGWPGSSQNGGGGATVISAYVPGIAQRIVGVVVAGDDDHAVARAEETWR